MQIRANLKAGTVEELQGRKRAMHLAAFAGAVAEARRDLERVAREGGIGPRLARDPGACAAGRFLGSIEARCRAVMERHAAVPAEAYAADEAYRALVVEMLDTKAAALSTLRFFLENDSFGTHMLMNVIPMRAAHRMYLALLEGRLPEGGPERAAAALRLCRTMGLVHAGADDRDADGWTRLMRAAADGDPPRAVRCLVAAGADPNAREPVHGVPALSFAVQNGHDHLLEVLAGLGADVNAASGERNLGSTPLHIAVQSGSPSAVGILLRLGADAHARGANGAPTPLEAARSMRRADLVALLAAAAGGR